MIKSRNERIEEMRILAERKLPLDSNVVYEPEPIKGEPPKRAYRVHGEARNEVWVDDLWYQKNFLFYWWV